MVVVDTVTSLHQEANGTSSQLLIINYFLSSHHHQSKQQPAKTLAPYLLDIIIVGNNLQYKKASSINIRLLLPPPLPKNT